MSPLNRLLDGCVAGGLASSSLLVPLGLERLNQTINNLGEDDDHGSNGRRQSPRLLHFQRFFLTLRTDDVTKGERAIQGRNADLDIVGVDSWRRYGVVGNDLYWSFFVWHFVPRISC